MDKMQTCGLANLRTGERVNCGPSLRIGSAYYPRALPVATARLPGGGLAALRALEFTLFMGPLPSLPPLPSSPPFLSQLLVRSLPVRRSAGPQVRRSAFYPLSAGFVAIGQKRKFQF